MPIENKIIDLYRKIICSLSCIENISNNNDIKIETHKYLVEFIRQYELYRNKNNINDIKFKYQSTDIIDFCNDCYNKVDIFDFAEDVEYGVKELMEVINKERNCIIK